MKLFIVEVWINDEWKPAWLYKGNVHDALAKAQSTFGSGRRVRRIKTPAEEAQYSHLSIINPGIEKIEWVN